MAYDKIIPEYPYNYFTVGYTNYHKSGRKILHLMNQSTGERLTIANARYVLSVHHRRILLRDEHVDHIDDDFLNDTVSNLQLLTPEQNRIKQASLVGLAFAIIICPTCHKAFARRVGTTQLVPSCAGRICSCSRNCSYDFIRKYNFVPEEVRSWISQRQIPFVVREYSSGVYLEKVFSHDLEFPHELIDPNRDYSKQLMG